MIKCFKEYKFILSVNLLLGIASAYGSHYKAEDFEIDLSCFPTTTLSTWEAQWKDKKGFDTWSTKEWVNVKLADVNALEKGFVEMDLNSPATPFFRTIEAGIIVDVRNPNSKGLQCVEVCLMLDQQIHNAMQENQWISDEAKAILKKQILFHQLLTRENGKYDSTKKYSLWPALAASAASSSSQSGNNNGNVTSVPQQTSLMPNRDDNSSLSGQFSKLSLQGGGSPQTAEDNSKASPAYAIRLWDYDGGTINSWYREWDNYRGLEQYVNQPSIKVEKNGKNSFSICSTDGKSYLYRYEFRIPVFNNPHDPSSFRELPVYYHTNEVLTREQQNECHQLLQAQILFEQICTKNRPTPEELDRAEILSLFSSDFNPRISPLVNGTPSQAQGSNQAWRGYNGNYGNAAYNQSYQQQTYGTPVSQQVPNQAAWGYSGFSSYQVGNNNVNTTYYNQSFQQQTYGTPTHPSGVTQAWSSSYQNYNGNYGAYNQSFQQQTYGTPVPQQAPNQAAGYATHTSSPMGGPQNPQIQDLDNWLTKSQYGEPRTIQLNSLPQGTYVPWFGTAQKGFYSNNGDGNGYAWLSNYFESGIFNQNSSVSANYGINVMIGGQSYALKNVEVGYQLFKFLSSNTPVNIAQFVNYDSNTARTAASSIKTFAYKQADQIISDLIKSKFFNNNKLAQALLSTGDMLLLEGNTWGDKRFGMEYNAATNTLTGEGKLSKMLHRIRAELGAKYNSDPSFKQFVDSASQGELNQNWIGPVTLK